MAELTKEELESLTKYRLITEKKTNGSIIKGKDLLQEKRLTALYEEILQNKLNTNKHSVIGSMLVKRYAFLAALVLYCMTIYDKGINSSIKNLSLQTDDDDPIWLPSFYFNSLGVTTPDTDRNSWRDTVITSLFKDNISLILTNVSKASKVSKSILWENIAIYIFWMYESLLEEESFLDEMKSKIREDFLYVILHAPAEAFGLKDKNPLTKYFHEKKNNVRKRSTCCLFYFTSKNGDRCQTCPIECK
jgi:ferric iron reductase protein FhuF